MYCQNCKTFVLTPSPRTKHYHTEIKNRFPDTIILMQEGNIVHAVGVDRDPVARATMFTAWTIDENPGFLAQIVKAGHRVALASEETAKS